MLNDSYHTIEREAVAEIKERSSRFIAYAYPVTDAKSAEQLVALLKKEHYSARHHCYAYRIGVGGVVNRANDDGEPSGTAGRPILGRMLSADVSDVLVVVVRYFGGILLGTSGLIAAYGDATEAVLMEAGRVEKVLREWVRFEIEYAQMDKFMRIVKRRELRMAPIEYEGVKCIVKLELRLGERDEVIEELTKKY